MNTPGPNASPRGEALLGAALSVLILSLAGCSGSAPKGAAKCATGQVSCSGVCTSVASDNANCGTCGNACSAGRVCSRGTCSFTCAAGTTLCSHSCVDTNVDPANCGGCNQPCGAQQACVNGSCYHYCRMPVNQPEPACNGRDDNCDGVVDDGCPKSLILANQTPVATSPLYGDSGGGAWGPDTCAPGSAVVGIHGFGGGNIDRFGLVCGTIVVTADTTTSPYTYSIAVGAYTDLALHGQTDTTPYRILCPAGAVVTRIDGVYDATARGTGSGTVPAGVHQLSVYCSAVTFSGTPTQYTFAFGTPTLAGRELSGYDLTGSQTFSFACPSGTAYVGGASGRAGSWLDALKPTCYAATLTLR